MNENLPLRLPSAGLRAQAYDMIYPAIPYYQSYWMYRGQENAAAKTVAWTHHRTEWGSAEGAAVPCATAEDVTAYAGHPAKTR